MYTRGGCVWSNQEGENFVFLAKDWDGGRILEDLVEEAGLLGTSFKSLSPVKRAKFAGYVKTGNQLEFFHQQESHRNSKKIYLAGDFNKWEQAKNDPRWELQPHSEDLFVLSSSQSKILLEYGTKWIFKLITEDGEWIEPEETYPCLKKNCWGSYDYLFNSSRTGSDIFTFEQVKGPQNKNLKKWLPVIPEGKFGYFQSEGYSNFRIFAPRVSSVDLLLFSDNENVQRRISMDPQEDGTWSVLLKENLEGKKYKYAISKESGLKEDEYYEKQIVDPYAKSLCSRNGPGIALTVKSGNGTRFEPPAAEELVILEAHLRDLLAHAPIELTDEERLEFRGLSKWLKSDDCYLKKLGVNAIELQPIHQFDSKSKDEYHWGYMPVNFFAPCSHYGSDAQMVNSEFKELVSNFHDSGLAVILDVVYNHVGIPQHLMHIDRELYFTVDQSNELSNHSGCGNDINPHSGATKKIILDSLVHWVEKFDIDGFRFDLAELIEVELLEEIEITLKKIKPNIILIAEPWSFRGRIPTRINRTNYSLWSDQCREKIFEYVSGKGSASEMVELLKGRLDRDNKKPFQSLNYLESHDDHTFIDRLILDSKNKAIYSEKISQLAKIATGILFVSPGIPMITAGQDWLKDKKGVRNTYQQGELNALNYKDLEKSISFHMWIKDLISFRLSDWGKLIRLKKFLSDNQYHFIENQDRSFAFMIFAKSEDQIPELLIIINPNDHYNSLNLPENINCETMKIIIGEKQETCGEIMATSFQIWVKDKN